MKNINLLRLRNTNAYHIVTVRQINGNEISGFCYMWLLYYNPELC